MKYPAVGEDYWFIRYQVGGGGVRIGFDIFESVGHPFRGIAHYERSLALALMSLDVPDELVFFSPPGGSGLLPGIPSGACRFRQARLTLEQHKLLWMMSNGIRMPLDSIIGPVDVFHAPDSVGPWLAHVPLVVTVHDLAPWIHPETCTWPNRVFYRTAFPISVRRATRIIADSESIRDDFCQWWPELASKTSVVHLAPSAHYRPVPDEDLFEAVRSRLGLPDVYLLSVGALERRKNYPLLLEAFATLAKQRAEWDRVRLVIVGAKAYRCEEISTAIQRWDLGERVILTDSLTDKELCQLYVHCLAFVLPSLYEGFGLPVVEAMACGAPVIVSMTAALTEVAGDAALTVDPHRVEDLVAALRVVIQEPWKREELRRRGLERARLFSWERAARETRQVYEEAVQAWCRERVCCTSA